MRSEFQIPVPHGKFADPRPMTDEVECDPQGPAVVSPEGVLGCDAVGDIELLANEPLRGRVNGWEVSFNQEDRRTGLVWETFEYEDSWRLSPSSSELANASESGVEVRALTFSSKRV